MTKRKLNPTQEAHLELLSNADLEWREAKTTAYERAKLAADKEVEALKIKRDILAHQAKAELKIPVTAITASLHTSASITGYAAIAAGEKYAPKHTGEATDAGPKEFAWTEKKNVLRITPPLAVVAPLLPLLGIEPEQYQEVPELQHADFEVDTAEGRIWSITDGFTEEHGRHPIVALVMGEDAGYRQRALEWAA